jgi:hypothetical protein
MRSGETIAVNAWLRVGFFSERDVHLTHASGTGNVRWMQPIPADSWSYTFYKLSVWEFGMLFLFFAWAIGSLL